MLCLLQSDLGKLGYAFQFVTLAGVHTLNHSIFQLAKGYAERGMSAYSTLQQAEIAAEKDGYTATKHQREVCSLNISQQHAKPIVWSYTSYTEQQQNVILRWI